MPTDQTIKFHVSIEGSFTIEMKKDVQTKQCLFYGLITRA